MILDRSILLRFLASFALLFTLLFLFAVTIDLVLNMGEYFEVAEEELGPDAGRGSMILLSIRFMLDLQAPRIFQFYAYLHGLLAIGSMAFTLVQMYRNRELIAVMAVGLSLHRIAVPFMIGTFLLSLTQMLNQELILPRIAPLLLRDRHDIGLRTVKEFPVAFVPDQNGSLFQAPSFNPTTGTITTLTILERDDAGRTARRIVADSAVWRPEGEESHAGTWELENGVATRPPDVGTGAGGGDVPVRFYSTNLTPEVLTARRYGQYMTMLNLRQIRSMLAIPDFADARTTRALVRQRYARFASVIVNLLVMLIALPSFLLREPANLLKQTILCAVMSIPAVFGASLLMMIDLRGITPALSVFLPVIVLGPIALARWTYLRT